MGTQLKIAASAAALIALATATVQAPTADAEPNARTAAGKARLKAFDSCKQLRKYRRDHERALKTGPSADQVEPETGDTGGPIRKEGEGAPGTAEASPTPDFSPTNVQEAGVDEPDIVKTDGVNVFALDGKRLYAIDAGAGGPRLLGSVELGRIGRRAITGPAETMLLSGSRALVFGRARSGNTLLTEVDVSDPAAMRVIETLNLEGEFVSARLNGTVARAVVSNSAKRNPRLPSSVHRNLLAGRKADRSKLTPCRSIRHPKRFSGLDMLTVLSIDLSQGLDPVDTDTVMTSGEIVYGSPQSLYVATERWLEPKASNRELSQTKTAIHKFSLEQGSTTYRASGEVPGYMLSQWSMSERNGLLRVASTTDPPFTDIRGRRSQSFVSILGEAGGRLSLVGRVGNIGRDEEIQSVRFIDDVGYVVTFRRIDPLHTVDLSVPTAPRVLGELQVRGYSAYLHPIGAGLLGVGQDASAEGLTLGTQLSIFDVSNPSSPLRAHQHVIADSYSKVEQNHLAFLYWEPEKLAVIPLEVLGSDGVTTSFAGAIGFRVDPKTGIQEVARITQGPAGNSPIERTLVAGGRLYTVSEDGVLTSNLHSFSPEGWVAFGP